MTTYRRRPEVVEAIQWTGDNLDEVRGWLGEVYAVYVGQDREMGVSFSGQRGTPVGLILDPTDYLVRDERGVHRETVEAFAGSYEAVEENDPREGLPLRRGG